MGVASRPLASNFGCIAEELDDRGPVTESLCASGPQLQKVGNNSNNTPL